MLRPDRSEGLHSSGSLRVTFTLNVGRVGVDGLDHVQVAAPPGCEREARELLRRACWGSRSWPKPEHAGARWWRAPRRRRAGAARRRHRRLRAPASKAHPGLRVDSAPALDALAGALTTAGDTSAFQTLCRGAKEPVVAPLGWQRQEGKDVVRFDIRQLDDSPPPPFIRYRRQCVAAVTRGGAACRAYNTGAVSDKEEVARAVGYGPNSPRQTDGAQAADGHRRWLCMRWSVLVPSGHRYDFHAGFLDLARGGGAWRCSPRDACGRLRSGAAAGLAAEGRAARAGRQRVQARAARDRRVGRIHGPFRRHRRP